MNEIVLLLTYKKIGKPPNSCFILNEKVISQPSTCIETEPAWILDSGFSFWRLDKHGPLPMDTAWTMQVEFLSPYVLLVRYFMLFPMAQEYI